jgi:hypothetical protein
MFELRKHCIVLPDMPAKHWLTTEFKCYTLVCCLGTVAGVEMLDVLFEHVLYNNNTILYNNCLSECLSTKL